MTGTLRQRLLPMLAGGLVLGLSMSAPASAEELRIGFIAPLTGIFAQIGKDMTNGFQMYLDEHHNKLGGAGTLVGGVIGSVIVFGLREYLSTLVPWWQYVLGGVYVLTILYLPTGLMGIPARLRQMRGSSDKSEKSAAQEKLVPTSS